MKERTQTFSELISRRVLLLAQDEPEKWNRPSDIAHQVSLALHRFYHPTMVTRLLRGQRGLLDGPEVRAWLAATERAVALAPPDERAEIDEAAGWHASGLLHPDASISNVRDLIAATKQPGPQGEIRTRTSYEPAGARILAFPAQASRVPSRVPTRPVAKVA